MVKCGPIGTLIALVTPLRGLHSIETLASGTARASYNFWSKLSTAEIVRSLQPGAEEALRVTRSGLIINGNVRISILRSRGVLVDGLPRELYP